MVLEIKKGGLKKPPWNVFRKNITQLSAMVLYKSLKS